MYSLIRKLLFRIDAEAAHEWTTDQLIALQEIPIAMRTIAALCRPPASASRQLLGLTFPSPIGIAAGFDKAFEADYAERLLNPYVAAERGYVDAVIDPAETRSVIGHALVTLADKRERIQPRGHDNTPL